MAVVDGDEGFHAATVRRIRPGEQLDLSDGAGALAHCVIEDVGKGRLTARVLNRSTVAPAAPAVTVVQALPKSDRSELAIELATEAGADALRGLAGVALRGPLGRAARVEKGLRRWRAVARVGRPPVPTRAHPAGDRRGVDRRVDAGEWPTRSRRAPWCWHCTSPPPSDSPNCLWRKPIR